MKSHQWIAHSSRHRGRHANIFGWAKSVAHDRRSASDLWPITINHNIGNGEDKQKSNTKTLLRKLTNVPTDDENMRQSITLFLPQDNK